MKEDAALVALSSRNPSRSRAVLSRVDISRAVLSRADISRVATVWFLRPLCRCVITEANQPGLQSLEDIADGFPTDLAMDRGAGGSPSSLYQRARELYLRGYGGHPSVSQLRVHAV